MRRLESDISVFSLYEQLADFLVGNIRYYLITLKEMK